MCPNICLIISDKGVIVLFNSCVKSIYWENKVNDKVRYLSVRILCSCFSKLPFRWVFEYLVRMSTIPSMKISGKLKSNVVLDILIFIYLLEDRELLCKSALNQTLSSSSLRTFCQLVSEQVW